MNEAHSRKRETDRNKMNDRTWQATNESGDRKSGECIEWDRARTTMVKEILCRKNDSANATLIQ
jgi:hypothetical protein